MDLPARSFDLVRPGMAPPLNSRRFKPLKLPSTYGPAAATAAADDGDDDNAHNYQVL